MTMTFSVFDRYLPCVECRKHVSLKEHNLLIKDAVEAKTVDTNKQVICYYLINMYALLGFLLNGTFHSSYSYLTTGIQLMPVVSSKKLDNIAVA